MAPTVTCRLSLLDWKWKYMAACRRFGISRTASLHHLYLQQQSSYTGIHRYFCCIGCCWFSFIKIAICYQRPTTMVVLTALLTKYNIYLKWSKLKEQNNNWDVYVCMYAVRVCACDSPPKRDRLYWVED